MRLPLPRFAIPVAIALVAALILVNFKRIDAGERGILYNSLSGQVDEATKGSGLHVYFSWYDMQVYDMRIAETKQRMNVLSKNGLDIEIELSLRYRATEDSLRYVFVNIGGNEEAYFSKIILPELRSVTREIVGKYDEEEIYNTQREQVQQEIYELMRRRLARHGILCETVLVRDINLPDEIQAAIKTKLKEQQQALQYEYRLQREEKEKLRKRIEAEGVADYQRIVNQSLTPNLLKLRGIEVTKELANSPNSKIVVIGSGEGGLPLILNGN
ncbi:MAG: prohibitin family protein [Bacteroidetes bacterium]|jgi:regulator of protease activity HflC (stomatin/prohibitin superfamily)|nr:prohibitin family protein [Bacteroidota bacterium]